ncbi:hypothetical protein [Paracoccus spongiarum]|uniref:DUF3329 domain-containing protein n=1 Tax=Paracoccus spongiarum TaxID=3064387 RepID=A0ABT9JGD0_9RHOB|nr:hypothetical protein [Paracoccus sp. 2205BS29-5]MDP5308890.1 hypothetical protein [Paracoccus sp. 2205BS29-5]
MPDRPLFLERASFRRRRLGDAARVLPIAATLLILVPAWWIPRSASSAGGAVWLFGLWATLIVAIWALHRALLRAEAATLRAEEAVAEAVRVRAGTATGTPAAAAPAPAAADPEGDPGAV